MGSDNMFFQSILLYWVLVKIKFSHNYSARLGQITNYHSLVSYAIKLLKSPPRRVSRIINECHS